MNAIPAFQASGIAEWLIGKGSNHSLKATVGKAKNTYPQMLPAYPQTPSTEDTLVRVMGENGIAIIYGEFPQQFPEAL